MTTFPLLLRVDYYEIRFHTAAHSFRDDVTRRNVPMCVTSAVLAGIHLDGMFIRNAASRGVAGTRASAFNREEAEQDRYGRSFARPVCARFTGRTVPASRFRGAIFIPPQLLAGIGGVTLPRFRIRTAFRRRAVFLCR